MSLAKITMWGFEGWLKTENKSLFDKLSLPAGIDKETLTDNIMLELGEFEVLYADPEVMRECVGLWARKWSRTFNKWITALNISYNPLENYDRQEEWTDSTHNTSSNTVNGTSTSTGTDTGDTTYKKTAYDSDSLHITGKEESTNTNTLNSTNGAETNGQMDGNGEHSGRIHGNIGVTTSQQMLQSEFDIARWNIYEKITDLFATEFCIMIYE